jgi:hypothetical protein
VPDVGGIFTKLFVESVADDGIGAGLPEASGASGEATTDVASPGEVAARAGDALRTDAVKTRLNAPTAIAERLPRADRTLICAALCADTIPPRDSLARAAFPVRVASTQRSYDAIGLCGESGIP